MSTAAEKYMAELSTRSIDAATTPSSSGSVNPNQAIFDAITASTRIENDYGGQSTQAIIIDTKKFIEAFNDHRDRALCTSINGVAQAAPKPISDDDLLGMMRRTLPDVVRKQLTRTRWKDGIDIDEPSEYVRDFIKEILASPLSSTNQVCPRCKKEPIDLALLGSADEGHICGTCWAEDRHASELSSTEGK